MSSNAHTDELAVEPDEECLENNREYGVSDGRNAFWRHGGLMEDVHTDTGAMWQGLFMSFVLRN